MSEVSHHESFVIFIKITFDLFFVGGNTMVSGSMLSCLQSVDFRHSTCWCVCLSVSQELVAMSLSMLRVVHV